MEATLGGGRPAGRPQGRCLPPTLRSPPWRRRWEEGGQRVAPRAVARRRRFDPTMEAALGGGRPAGHPQGRCGGGLRFAPPLGRRSPPGGRLVLRSPELGAKGRRVAVMAPPAGHRRYCGRVGHATGRGRTSPSAAGHRGQGPTPGRPLVTGPRQQRDKGKEQGAHPASHPKFPIRHLGNASPSASRQCIPVDQLEIG